MKPSSIRTLFAALSIPTAAVGSWLALAACSSNPDGGDLGATTGETSEEILDGDDVDFEAMAAAVPCHSDSGATPGRWELDPDLVDAALHATVPIVGFVDAGACVDGSAGTKLARALCAQLLKQFAGEFANPVLQCNALGTVNKVCRDIAESNTPSMHASGRAIDIFVPPDTQSIDPTTARKYVVNGTDGGTNANNARGDRIAHWIIANANELHVQRVIWDRSSWSSTQGKTKLYWQGKDGGLPHNNHIHVEVTHDACEDAGAAACKHLH